MHDFMLAESVRQSRSLESAPSTSQHPYRVGIPLLERQPRYGSPQKPLHFNPLRFCLPGPTAQERQSLIAEKAYFRALQRGFRSGHELEDWLAAEAEVDQADVRRRNGYTAW